MTTKAIRVWYAMTVTFVVTIAFAGASVLYANHAADQAVQRSVETDRESNRRWCTLLVTMDEAYRESPPSTEAGKTMAAEVTRLRAEFGCD